jgi:hypothetical protein
LEIAFFSKKARYFQMPTADACSALQQILRISIISTTISCMIMETNKAKEIMMIQPKKKKGEEKEDYDHDHSLSSSAFQEEETPDDSTSSKSRSSCVPSSSYLGMGGSSSSSLDGAELTMMRMEDPSSPSASRMTMIGDYFFDLMQGSNGCNEITLVPDHAISTPPRPPPPAGPGANADEDRSPMCPKRIPSSGSLVDF